MSPSQSVSGTLSFVDTDASDQHTIHIISGPSAVGYFTAQIDGVGHITWNYQVDQATLHSMTTNLVEPFQIVLDDGLGGSTSATIVVTTNIRWHPPCSGRGPHRNVFVTSSGTASKWRAARSGLPTFDYLDTHTVTTTGGIGRTSWHLLGSGRHRHQRQSDRRGRLDLFRCGRRSRLGLPRPTLHRSLPDTSFERARRFPLRLSTFSPVHPYQTLNIDNQYTLETAAIVADASFPATSRSAGGSMMFSDVNLTYAHTLSVETPILWSRSGLSCIGHHRQHRHRHWRRGRLDLQHFRCRPCGHAGWSDGHRRLHRHHQRRQRWNGLPTGGRQRNAAGRPDRIRDGRNHWVFLLLQTTAQPKQPMDRWHSPMATSWIFTPSRRQFLCRPMAVRRRSTALLRR